eukprot:scaffold2830_cov131-Cylindrotheca_fusiformis.AAC.7
MVIDEEALRTQPSDEGRNEKSAEFQQMNASNSNDNLRIKSNIHHGNFPEAPKSGAFRLPLKMNDLPKKKQPPRLLHP